jgi:AmpE protein
MTLIAMGVTFLLLRALHGLLFNVPLLVAWILLGLLCIGAGKVRLHYHAYLNAAARDDAHAREAMASELTLIHGVPPDCDEREFLRELQNALLWINFRFYLAPLFWLIVGGPWGPVTLIGYAFYVPGRPGWRAIRRRTSVCSRVLMRSCMCWTGSRCVWRAWSMRCWARREGVASVVCLACDRILRSIRCLRVWRSSRWRANRIPIKSKRQKRLFRWKRTSFVVVVIMALLTIYGALALCRMALRLSGLRV